MMPALCTMMSSAPCRVPGVLEDPPAARRAPSRRAAGRCRGAGSRRAARRSPGGGHVDADHGRAVASEHLGDRRADAPSGAGDDGDLAGQRRLPVVRGDGRRRRRRRRPGGPGRRRRPSVRRGRTAARASALASAPLDDGDEVGRGAGPQLLADRPDDALEGPAAWLAASGRCRRSPSSRPNTTTRPLGASRFRAGPRIVREGVEIRRAPSPGSGRGPRRRPVAPRPRRGSMSTASPRSMSAARAASGASRHSGDEHRTRDEGLRPAHSGAVAPAGAARAATRRCLPTAVDEVAVGVRHRSGRLEDATTPWPPAAQMEISPRDPEPFSCNSFARVATIRPPVAANG